MRRAVLLTGHFPHQKRRASMLWLSDALQELGWHVTLATVGYSWLSRLRRDPRLRALGRAPRPGMHQVSDRLTTLFGWSPVHPFGTGNSRLDAAVGSTQPLFSAYWHARLAAPLSAADIVVIESGPPVQLAPMARRAAMRARLVYRVNDDIRLLGAPGYLRRAERRNAELFDRISTASPHLAALFAGHRRVTLDPMGIPRTLVERELPDPYLARTGFEAVCAGTTQLDMPALVRIALDNPNWRLHVLGRLRRMPPKLPNLVFHGECEFDATLAHIAHADIGLAPYLDRPGVEYQATNSNRILLYRHFGLPVLGPDRLCDPTLPGIMGYSRPGVYRLCQNRGRKPEILPDWAELARRLVQNGVTEPPFDTATDPERVACRRV